MPAGPKIHIEVGTASIEALIKRIQSEGEKMSKGTGRIGDTSIATADATRTTKAFKQSVDKLNTQLANITSGKGMAGPVGKTSVKNQHNAALVDSMKDPSVQKKIAPSLRNIMGRMFNLAAGSGVQGTALRFASRMGAIALPAAAVAGFFKLMQGQAQAAKDNADTERSLHASARLQGMRLGPNNAYDSYRRAIEASRVRSAAQKADELGKQTIGIWESLKAKAGLTTPDVLTRKKEIKQTLDASAAALRSLGVPEQNIDQQSKKGQPLGNNMKRAFFLKMEKNNVRFKMLSAINHARWPDDPTKAMNVTFGQFNSAHPDEFRAQLEVAELQQAADTHNHHLRIRLENQEKQDRIAQSPISGFKSQELRKAKEFLLRFHRPRMSGMKRD